MSHHPKSRAGHDAARYLPEPLARPLPRVEVAEQRRVRALHVLPPRGGPHAVRDVRAPQGALLVLAGPRAGVGEERPYAVRSPVLPEAEEEAAAVPAGSEPKKSSASSSVSSSTSPCRT